MAGLGKFWKLAPKLVGGGVDVKVAVLTGTTANTAIAVTGLKLGAQILAAIEFTAGVPSDIGSGVSISSAGNVKFTADTSGNTVLLVYAQSAK